MARPFEGDWILLKRMGGNLEGTPCVVQRFEWQDESASLDTFVDSDWAGCKPTCESTSGGATVLGTHCISAWSPIQGVIALSSGEAELYAMLKGATMTIGFISLAADFGRELQGKVHSDASAAIAIANRSGVGKLRHVRVQYFWLQQRVRDKDIVVQKLAGTENPADIMAKHLSFENMSKHVTKLNFSLGKDRAKTAPKLEYVAVNTSFAGASASSDGAWTPQSCEKITRQHVKPTWESIYAS